MSTNPTDDCGPIVLTPEQKLANLQAAYDALERNRQMWERAVFALRAQVWATECSNRAMVALLSQSDKRAAVPVRVEVTHQGLFIALCPEALADLRAGNSAAWECIDNAVRETVKRHVEYWPPTTNTSR